MGVCFDSFLAGEVVLIQQDNSDQGGVDDPKQSACGIPHNAYSISHVAIHPYWLKYAPLDSKVTPFPQRSNAAIYHCHSWNTS